MNLTLAQLRFLLNNPKLKEALFEFDNFSNINFDALETLSDSDLSHLQEGVVYVAKNYFDDILNYDNPPLMEMEPLPPIVVYGIPGLYMVHEQWMESNEANFFSDEKEAIKFSEEAYATFLDIYKTISGEN
jgi:hypothetical protein